MKQSVHYFFYGFQMILTWCNFVEFTQNLAYQEEINSAHPAKNDYLSGKRFTFVSFGLIPILMQVMVKLTGASPAVFDYNG